MHAAATQGAQEQGGRAPAQTHLTAQRERKSTAGVCVCVCVCNYACESSTFLSMGVRPDHSACVEQLLLPIPPPPVLQRGAGPSLCTHTRTHVRLFTVWESKGPFLRERLTSQTKSLLVVDISPLFPHWRAACWLGGACGALPPSAAAAAAARRVCSG